MKITLTVCTKNQYKDKQGIHLNCPDLWYLNRALDDADKDMFTTIYLHYEPIYPAMYKIPCEVLNRLVELALLKKQFKVKFTEPTQTTAVELLNELY